MTKLMTTLTISAIAAILIIGGFATATPNAFSSYGENDDCGYGSYGNHDDDCGNDKPDDPCDCEKPDTLKFIFSAPAGEELSEFKIEVFKKLKDMNNTDKKLTSIIDVINGTEYQLQASNFGKGKLNSNTVFVIYKVAEGQDNELVASMEIHTSCSKPLYKGLVVSNNGYSLGVTDGLKKGKTSIPHFDPMICEDETKPKKIGKIIVRKALTNDNGGDADVTDFTITVTNVETGISTELVRDQVDPMINVIEVAVGKYILSETTADTVTSTYTTVLIAGDSKCPEMFNEEFIIKKGETLSCTIYNDDNGDGSSGNGVFFVRNSISFDPATSGTCIMDTGVINNSPCIVVNGGTLFIADPTLDDPAKAPTAIITSTIIQITTEPLSPPECVFLGISEMNGAVGFGVDCQGIQVDGISTYNANYAIIDASLQG